MNLFILSRSKRRAAKYHFDSHVVKIILEAAQVASSALFLVDADRFSDLLKRNTADTRYVYRAGWLGHPCVLWCATSLANYTWTCRYGLALCSEYSYRFHKQHSTQAILDSLLSNTPPEDKFPVHGRTPFAQAMPSQYRNDDPVAAYRAYYMSPEKYGLASWRRRSKPHWYAVPNKLIMTHKRRKQPLLEDSTDQRDSPPGCESSESTDYTDFKVELP